jgi:hypothetical protein
MLSQSDRAPFLSVPGHCTAALWHCRTAALRHCGTAALRHCGTAALNCYAAAMSAAREAFQHLIDYAGLYPPASLSMDVVVRNFAQYRSGAHDWMLGRLIVPAERLVEVNALATASGARPDARWPVSVLVGGVDAIQAQSARVNEAMRRDDGALEVVSIEATAASAEDIARLAHRYGDAVERFVEIPAEPDPAPLFAALSMHACAGKIRTGGVTADKIPSPALVARFLTRALAARVPVKATAGLHHAIRSERPLTYAIDSPMAVMHGFANLTLAATLLVAGRIDEELAEALLDDDRPEAFKFCGRAASWLNAVVTYGEISHARHVLLRSVGSCSFDEPVSELAALEWI